MSRSTGLGWCDGWICERTDTAAVSGYLIKQLYKEGSLVQAGQILFEIDPRPFQAMLDQAEGQLAQSKAQLELAKINVARDTLLVAARAIAKSQLATEDASLWRWSSRV